MNESLGSKEAIEKVAARAAEIHMAKARQLRDRLAPKISLRHMREWQYIKAAWHEKRAQEEAEETRHLLGLGVMTLEQTKRFEELTDKDREPYIPEVSEFPPEVVPPELHPPA